MHGIYLINEANIESHDYGNDANNKLAHDPAWTEAIVSRVQRMVLAQKNHPSVLVWSLGNEAGSGPNFVKAAEWSRATDPTRPVHYEGGDRSIGDFSSRMYAPVDWLADDGRPSILCEYTHAMGNSNGNLREYWHDNIYQNRTHAGAFVWDWMNQGLTTPVPEAFRKNIGKGPVKETFFAYGGWHRQPYKHDDNFCMNGLLGADWKPHPGLYAIKYVYRNIHAEPVDLAVGKVRIRNWFDFSNTRDRATAIWEVLKDGEMMKSGPLEDLDIAPHSEKTVTLDLPQIDGADAEYLLNLRFFSKKGTPLVKAGHEISWEQFPLGEAIGRGSPIRPERSRWRKRRSR